MSFQADNRAVSEVIGAVLLFGMLVVAFSTYQAYIIPNQNSEIEGNHYTSVQDDLRQLQGTITTAGDASGTRSASVNLGPTYPSRLFGLNAGTPRGQLRAESVGSGEIQSSEVPLNDICRLEAGGPDAVPTNAIVYDPGYNYYQSGNVLHRLEGTLLYQEGTVSGGALARTGPTMVDTTARSVTLYPLDADVQSSGVGAEIYRFVGGYGERTMVRGPSTTITIPTQASLRLWQERIDAGNSDITVTDGGTDAVDITFSGQWEFNCRPVAQGKSPEQLPTADAGADTSVSEGATTELDGTGSRPASTITTYSWTLGGSQPSGVTLNEQNTATPVVDASGVDVSTDTTFELVLSVTDDDGNTNTDTVDVTVQDTDTAGNGTIPSLTGTASDLPAGSTGTNHIITFSPTEQTLPNDEEVIIDLSQPDGGTSGNPDPVHYGEGSINFNFPQSNIDAVSDSGNYIIEWSPAAGVPTGRTITVNITNVKTQGSSVNNLEVVMGRSDGDGTTAKFAVGTSSSDTTPPTFTAGPSASPSTVTVGESFDLTATLDDSGSNIASASWTDRSGNSGTFTAQDGDFDSQTETIEDLSIDTTGWNTGDHVIGVTGTDASGNSVTANVTVTIEQPALPSGRVAFNDADSDGVYDSDETAYTDDQLSQYQDSTVDLVIARDISQNRVNIRANSIIVQSDTTLSANSQSIDFEAEGGDITVEEGADLTTRNQDMTLEANGGVDISGASITSGTQGNGRQLRITARDDISAQNTFLRGGSIRLVANSDIDLRDAIIQADTQTARARGGTLSVNDNGGTRADGGTYIETRNGNDGSLSLAEGGQNGTPEKGQVN